MSELHRSPATLARPFAQELATGKYLDTVDVTDHEIERLLMLEQQAHDAGFFDGQYLVESGRSILLPVNFDADEPLSATLFPELRFAGELKTFSMVRLPKRMGENAMRALCLTFGNVTLLPDFDTVPDDLLLHVPASAVKDIDHFLLSV